MLPSDWIIIIVFQGGVMQSTGEGEIRGICQRRHNGQSLDEYRHFKLLPHISEQYEFRITNKLLIQKIVNPRRDRIIIDSLAHTASAHFYKNKKPSTPHQETSNYRRKNVLTAAHKKRQNTNTMQQKECIQHEQTNQKPINNANSQHGRRKDYASKGQDYNWPQFQKDNEMTISRMIESQGLRNNFIGKIIRNNSGHLMKIPRRAILKSNYYLNNTDNTCQQEQPKQISREIPQSKIKRIVKRIYHQYANEKQNLN